jgi:large subunit ribosomal protein L15
MLTLHSLHPNPRKTHKRVGRGNASGSGTTAGKGTKGQKARTGGKGGLKLRGLKAIFKSVPKAKGFTSQYPKISVMNLSTLEERYAASKVAHVENYKILGQGELTKAITVYAAAFSTSAKSKIEQQGGKAITCGKHS